MGAVFILSSQGLVPLSAVPEGNRRLQVCGWWRSGEGGAYTGEIEQDDQSSAHGWMRGIGAMKRATDSVGWMQDIERERDAPQETWRGRSKIHPSSKLSTAFILLPSFSLFYRVEEKETP